MRRRQEMVPALWLSSLGIPHTLRAASLQSGLAAGESAAGKEPLQRACARTAFSFAAVERASRVHLISHDCPWLEEPRPTRRHLTVLT